MQFEAIVCKDWRGFMLKYVYILYISVKYAHTTCYVCTIDGDRTHDFLLRRQAHFHCVTTACLQAAGFEPARISPSDFLVVNSTKVLLIRLRPTP